jgi:hypothetical protein
MAASRVKRAKVAGVSWFVLSGLVTLWHVCFVFLRPRSLPGGDLNHFFPGYHLFLSVGKPYADVDDPLIWALGWCNIGEILLGFVAAFLILMGRPMGDLVGLTAATMSFWKTVLCIVLPSPLCSSPSQFSNVNWRDLLFFYAVPISPWILITGALMVHYIHDLSTSVVKLNKITAKGKMPKNKGD